MTYPRSKWKSKSNVTCQQIAFAISVWGKMVVTKVNEARLQGQVENSGKGQEKRREKDREEFLHRAKATLKDSKTMTWKCLRDGALA